MYKSKGMAELNTDGDDKGKRPESSFALLIECHWHLGQRAPCPDNNPGDTFTMNKKGSQRS